MWKITTGGRLSRRAKVIPNLPSTSAEKRPVAHVHEILRELLTPLLEKGNQIVRVTGTVTTME